MIKALVYYDGNLNDKLSDYYYVSELVKSNFSDLEVVYIGGDYGYSNNIRLIERAGSLPTNYVVFTNSPFVVNADIAKEQCSDEDGFLVGFYVFADGKITNLNKLNKKIKKGHNLEKIITKGEFKKC